MVAAHYVSSPVLHFGARVRAKPCFTHHCDDCQKFDVMTYVKPMPAPFSSVVARQQPRTFPPRLAVRTLRSKRNASAVRRLSGKTNGMGEPRGWR